MIYVDVDVTQCAPDQDLHCFSKEGIEICKCYVLFLIFPITLFLSRLLLKQSTCTQAFVRNSQINACHEIMKPDPNQTPIIF